MICGVTSSAQSIYLSPVFNEIQTSTIEYTEGFMLDIYQAQEDTTSAKPLILYVHGGGFSSGRRNEPNFVEFANRLAQHGYIVVSISYPLPQKNRGFGCHIPHEEKVTAVRIVGTYINLARDFLIENAAEFDIDKDKVVLMGSSAGAESILHAAYWDACTTSSENNLYAGLVSMAGAIMNTDWIQKDNIIPMLLFHGTCDELVPYGSAPHHYCEPDSPGYWYLHGGAAIAQRAQELDCGYFLYTDCGGGHEWHDKAFTHAFYEIIDFLYQDILLNKIRQLHQVENRGKNCPEFPQINCAASN